MLADDRFKDVLAPALPKGENFVLFHLRTNPKKANHLIFTSTKDTSFDLVSHHLFILHHDTAAVLALEIDVFESRDFVTVFISKADSSGHYYGEKPLDLKAVVLALTRGLLRYYVPAQKPVRISLFAKAESQYLFMGSKDNSRKHVLTDAQLVKWWGRVLDELATEFEPTGLKATLQIPGASENATKTYLPVNPRLPWQIGDIYSADDDTTWAVRCIPRFPDDPKHRFLDFLVAENRVKRVNCKQFWAELESRQEFRLGTSVGVFGIQGVLKVHETLEGGHSFPQKRLEAIKDALVSANYSSKQEAEQSSNRLAHRAPETAVIQIEGERELVAKRKIEQVAAVNTLNSMLVRKKKKA